MRCGKRSRERSRTPIAILYEEIETAQGLIKDGAESKNAARVKQGADDQVAAVKRFLASNGPDRPWSTTRPPLASSRARRRLVGAVLLVGLVVAVGFVGAGPAGARRPPRPATPRERCLETRPSSSSAKCGARSIAHCGCSTRDDGLRPSRESRTGYLNCFEAVEAQLDVVAGVNFRFQVEDVFARVRGLIETKASTGEIRERIVTLRGLIDDSERHLTAKGLGAPALAFGQSFTLLLREGLEAVLLLSVLLTYLESSAHARQKRPIMIGVGLAILATVVTFFAVDAIFSVLPFGREVLEAVVGLLAVAMLFYVTFWLIARLDQRRRMEFLQARVWRAASVGSAATRWPSWASPPCTARGSRRCSSTKRCSRSARGCGPGSSPGMVAADRRARRRAWAVLKLGRKLPVKRFLTVALVIVMFTSVAVLGNAMRALQEAAVIDLHVLDNWPNLPIYLAQATGYYPTLPSVVAQAALIVVYLVGAVVTYGYAARRKS